MSAHEQCSDRNGVGLDRLEDDVETFGPAVPVDLRDAGFDMPQPPLLLAQRTLHLRPLQRQHGPQFGWRDLVLQQWPDLLQRQAEFLQRENAVQPRQLPDAVVAIAGLGIDMGGLQQSELVVEPQLPARDLRDLGEFTDPEHQNSLSLR